MFYPYNATGLSTSSAWFYYCGNTARGELQLDADGHLECEGLVPATYHQWVSAIKYHPTNTYDKELFKDQTS